MSHASTMPLFDFMDTATDRDYRAKAEAWIAKHPEVYALFERFALQAAAKGRRFGVKLLAERVRWECFFQRDAEDTFKINNSLVAFIARRLVRDHPKLEKYIEFRKVRS